MEKKDALNDELLETKIFLKDDFKNEQTVPVYKITAPNGYTDLFRQSMSENCQHMLMWQNCGCTIERIMEDREVRGCNINGVQLKQIDTRVLVFTTKGKAAATESSLNKVKPGLLLMGISIDHHECEPYIPKKRVNNCHDGTILDTKYG
jgi:hypothetical protein